MSIMTTPDRGKTPSPTETRTKPIHGVCLCLVVMGLFVGECSLTASSSPCGDGLVGDAGSRVGCSREMRFDSI
ncbi:hypothetical protein BO71DRAFT_197463 [Aspergillus ellipticus CBS 707.79]|uniref:Uncharacterized protein n=1 Tax=Aspergillus ellipticus CBS 707.79 TaxID=1448320 RepID=A0A319DF10_9EURO|nr:hypothetical protein BO71DRAFT_197463 [Aspergillus ellipticus CBS 707.79]